MKSLNAVRFRIILIVAFALVSAAAVGVFLFGYQIIQGSAADTGRRQADAKASENTINNLAQLRKKIDDLKDVQQLLSQLRSTNQLPQFDTERSVRTIAEQLNIPIQNITFVDGGAATADQPAASGAAATTPPAAAPQRSTISFEFGRALSYRQLIEFLHAVETTIPKLTIQGIDLPDGSTGSSIEPGTITIEIATGS